MTQQLELNLGEPIDPETDSLAILRLPPLEDYRRLARDGGCDPIQITEAQLRACAAALVMHSWRGFVDRPRPFLARACDPSTHTFKEDAVRSCIARDSRGRCWVFATGDAASDRDVLRWLDSWEVQP
jgi:hypothetical protein